eukprot:COSAG01_NODE_1404_length_10443_cov_29.217517_12_plen_101_part_00
MRCRYDENVGEEDVVIGAITVPLAIEGPEATLSLQDWYALTDRRKKQVSARARERERERQRQRQRQRQSHRETGSQRQRVCMSGGIPSGPFLSAETRAPR